MHGHIAPSWLQRNSFTRISRERYFSGLSYFSDVLESAVGQPGWVAREGNGTYVRALHSFYNNGTDIAQYFPRQQQNSPLHGRTA